MSPFSFQCSLQVELLLAEFFASITLFIIAVSAERTPHALNAPILWRAFLLLGALNTALSYRNVKKAVRGVDNFDFRKAGIVWGSLLISWAMFNAPLEDRLYPGSKRRASYPGGAICLGARSSRSGPRSRTLSNAASGVKEEKISG
ncbi:hypothetical protein C8R43DRAFT_1187864 [Mycena crocata]|nr:hypothetical protein C8R43DRAFT_1187864 [Mycena crocata]